MQSKLLTYIMSFFNQEMTAQAAQKFGVHPATAQSVIGMIVPYILKGFTSKAAEGAETSNHLFSLAKEATNGNWWSQISSMFSDNNMLDKGEEMLNSLFGNKNVDRIAAQVATSTKVEPSVAHSLMKWAAPVTLGALGKYSAENNFSSAGLLGLLNTEKAHFDGVATAATGAATVLASHTTKTYSPKKEANTSKNNAWIPILLLLIAGALTWFFLRGCNDEVPATGTTTGVVDTVSLNTASSGPVETPATVYQPTGSIDSFGNFIYNVGNTVTIDLPNNGGQLTVGENATEARLVKFLQSSEAVDTAKGNWFDFTNVRFATGSNKVTEESKAQLKNLVLISKAFPNARFKIGGYTDNTGDEAQNVTLSKNRAAAIAAMVKEMGAANIVSSDGYGSQFPIGDNNTPEGKAMNRRVSVNVKAK